MFLKYKSFCKSRRYYPKESSLGKGIIFLIRNYQYSITFTSHYYAKSNILFNYWSCEKIDNKRTHQKIYAFTENIAYDVHSLFGLTDVVVYLCTVVGTFNYFARFYKPFLFF